MSAAPLARMNPSVKLVVLFVVSLALVSLWDPVTPALLWAAAVAGTLAFAGVRVRTLALAHLPFLAFGTGLFLVNALSRPGEALWHLGSLSVTDEGVSVGLSLVMRTLTIGVASIAFLATTDPVALMTSAHQNLKVPARFTYAMLAGHQLLQDLPEEWATIRAAHRVRRPARAARSSERLGVREAGSIAFTLLIVALRRSERISRALESRGLGLSPRTVYRPVRVRAVDLAAAGAILAVFAGIVLATGYVGILEGFDALT